MITQCANKNDIPALKALWKQGFGDSDKFIEWYFSSRFKSEYCSITKEKNGKIVSMAYFQPMAINIRQRAIKAAMLNGVYTLPEYRKKGLMHKNVLRLEHIAKEHGLPIMINTPSGKNHYHTLGHRYITKCDKITISPRNKSSPLLINNIMDYCEDTLKAYSSMYKKYSCMIYRDIAAQKERFSDYISNNAQLLTYHDSDKLTAYAIIYEMPNKYICPECVFIDNSDNILKEISHLDKPCVVKLPCPKLPFAVGCITDVANLLSNFNLPYSIEVSDNQLAHNNGVFSLDKKVHSPAIKISASSLIQLIAGYSALNEICDIIVYHEKEFNELNSIFIKHQCYMIEEY